MLFLFFFVVFFGLEEAKTQQAWNALCHVQQREEFKVNRAAMVTQKLSQRPDLDIRLAQGIQAKLVDQSKPPDKPVPMGPPEISPQAQVFIHS